MTQVTYIWHDCFVVELREFTMVFDFWLDPIKSNEPIKHNEKIPLFLKGRDSEKPIYIFVSHHHKDHYTKKIFEWSRLFPNITYIISEDVGRHARHILSEDSLYKGHKPSKDKCFILKEGDSYMDLNIKVEAFGSTDIGNSYFVEAFPDCASKRISFFHAGDLNAWLWKDESTEEEVETALRQFTSIVDRIASAHPQIDYVMFPVDSRIGTDYASGARIFVKAIYARHFFPMHFCIGESEEEILKRGIDAACLSAYAEDTRGEYICLLSPYSTYSKA